MAFIIHYPGGCPKAPTNSYTAVYGNVSDPRAYLLQAEADKAPVYPQPMELIRFSCNAGYTEMYQDRGSPWVRCNEGGYDRIPIHCVGEWQVIIVIFVFKSS